MTSRNPTAGVLSLMDESYSAYVIPATSTGYRISSVLMNIRRLRVSTALKHSRLHLIWHTNALMFERLKRINLKRWSHFQKGGQLANITFNRRASSVKNKKSRLHNDSSDLIYGRMELDSHDNTIVLGSNVIIMHYTHRECDVSPYADTYQPIQNVPIVSGTTAVTNTTDGSTHILVFNEAIWIMGNILDHSLLNPNQLRAHGITVQDNPYGDSAMHIAAPTDDFRHPMDSEGTTIYFNSRTPTNHELATCLHIVMLSGTEWNPRDVQLPAPHLNVTLRRERTSPVSMQRHVCLICHNLISATDPFHR